MKASQTSKRSPKNLSAGKGVVQVAIWKDSEEILKHQDVFTQHSHEVFYDFMRPLKVLESPGWNPMIKVNSEGSDGFFVFTSDEKPYFE